MLYFILILSQYYLNVNSWWGTTEWI